MNAIRSSGVDFLLLGPAQARLIEAKRFFELYLTACGPPKDDIVGMVAALDAFLFCLASALELSGIKPAKADILAFICALRNLTAHQSVPALIEQPKLNTRPLCRIVSTSTGSGAQSDTADFLVRPAVMAAAFREAGENYLRARPLYDLASTYIMSIQTANARRLRLTDLLKCALASAESNIQRSHT